MSSLLPGLRCCRYLQVHTGGLVFFRESCFRQSGDVKRSSNPTHYRNPRDYFAIFDGVEVRERARLL